MPASSHRARDRANQLADRVIIPNARYRRDIGDRLIAGELDRVKALGLLGRGASESRELRASTDGERTG